MIFLGIDIGSVTVKVAAVDESRQVLFTDARRSKGLPARVLSDMLRELERSLGLDRAVDRVIVTGSGRALVPLAPGVQRRSEILAHARAAVELAPDALSVIEIGGQDSKFILLDPQTPQAPVKDYAFNDLCAAGTGAFLDQQAARLGMSVKDLSRRAAEAEAHATVAGRCAVFAKSDMIHLQQKGVPLDQILSGLCYALARNYIATLLRGREVVPPVLFLGGVSKNEGVVKAFKELLELSDSDVISVQEPSVTGALGAAILALSAGPASSPVMLSELESGNNIRKSERDKPRLKSRKIRSRAKPVSRPPKSVFLGVDVGSVSTCMALVDRDGRLVASSYVKTRGRPIEALSTALEEVRADYPGRDMPRVLYVGTTGSGRQIAAAVLGGDVIKDEITAQATAAVHLAPEADTIVEIGGQDAKLILLEGGVVKDFALNRVCAAGTGSFLEEQAERLSIRVDGDFSDMAFSSESPAGLGNRCTVFMDADLIHHQQRGRLKEDLVAGLAYAVVENYIEKVAQGRKLGSRIVFLGGVAANKAVVAALAEMEGKPVVVPSEHKVSGAMGAALLAREAWLSEGEPATGFRGFDVSDLDVRASTFQCRGCENLCEVSRITVGDEPARFFGGACERYERGADGPTPGAWLFEERQRLLFEGIEVAGPDEDSDIGPKAIGLPRALQNFDLVPLYASMLKELGLEPVISGRSSKAILNRGLSLVTAEACFPVKLLFGHVKELLDAGVRKILLPNLLELPSGPIRAGSAIPEPMRVQREFPCLFTQAAPDLVRAGMVSEEDVLVAPRLALNPTSPEWRTGMEELAHWLGVDVEDVLKAADTGMERYRQVRRAIVELGKEALEDAGSKPVVVMLGRPYNLHDELLNLSMARKLHKLGALAVPMDALPLEQERLGPEWNSLYWRAGRDIVRALKIIRRNPEWLTIMVTGFGCGPDAFIQKYVESELEARSLLVLEVDEHMADAGLLTRLEAFLEAGARKQTEPEVSKPVRPTPFGKRPLDGRTVMVPDINPCMRAYVAAFRSAGYDSELLPGTDLESLELGMVHSSGRECNPYSFILGDLLKLCNRSDIDLRKTAVFVPATDGPCLLAQYVPGYELVLKKAGMDDLLLYSPNFAEFSELVGIRSVIRFWEGLVAIDVLQKLLSWRERAEVRKGEARSAYEEGLLVLEGALEGVVPMDQALKSAVELLVEATPGDPPDGPVIGLVGDVFTRAVPAANANLVEKLEERGCRVLSPPALLDIGWYMVEENVWLARLRGELAGAMTAKLKGILQTMLGSRLEAAARELMPLRREPGFERTRELLKGRLCFRMDTPLSLNVAKALDFLDQGCDGVVNAICHGCMVGLVSEAVFRKIEREQDAPPIVTLTFDGLQETNTETRLDALVEVARARAEKRKAKQEQSMLARILGGLF